MVIFHKGYSTVGLVHFYTTKCPIKQFSFRPIHIVCFRNSTSMKHAFPSTELPKSLIIIKQKYIYIFHGAQTSVCVTIYVHMSTLYRRTAFMFICQSTVIGFWKRCFVVVHSQVCCGSVLSASGRQNLAIAGRNRWRYCTEWKLRFIQNIACCYVLCLTKESVNTATLVHAPVCVCATHTARRSAWC